MTTWKRREVIGNATLFLGDCLEILPTLPKVDAVITDPPYGVGVEYSGDWVDDEALIDRVCVPAINIYRSLGRVAMTPGNKHLWRYPKPDDVGVWFNPAGTGFSPWGFQLAHIIIYYGKCPNRNSGNSTWAQSGGEKDNRHPCSKPFEFMRWIVGKASVEGETVLDPFMGSGSTGIACLHYNRPFIGIEIEPKYFDIACERIENAQRQERLFA